MNNGRSVNVVERVAARQTEQPLVPETVPQLGRLASLPRTRTVARAVTPGGQPVSARTGGVRQSQRAEERMSDESRSSIGIDVSQATLDLSLIHI